ncbi:MAG: hypothetical protein V1723_03565 [Candidatus Uhrbacteria bacterium]
MNFLSQHNREIAQARLAFYSLRIIAATLIIASAITSAALLTGQFILERNFRTVVEQSSLILRTHQRTSQGIRSANTLIRSLHSFQAQFTPWSATIVSIVAGIPNGTTLRELTINNGSLHLAGRTPTRADLLALQQNINDLPIIGSVTIPFAQFLEPLDINFTADAALTTDDHKTVAP